MSCKEQTRNFNPHGTVQHVTSWAAAQLPQLDTNILDELAEPAQLQVPRTYDDHGMPGSASEFTEVHFDTYEYGALVVCVTPDDAKDETVGITTPEKIMLTEQDGTQVTARDVILGLHNRAINMGYKSVDANINDQERIVVRFECVLVPLGPEEAQRRMVPTYSDPAIYRRQGVEYYPRNIVVLGTPNAIYVHSKAKGTNRFYLNSKEEEGVKNWWLVTEDSNVLDARAAATDDQLTRNKSQFAQVGLNGVCCGANCFVLISIPNTERPNPNANDDAITTHSWYPTTEFTAKNIPGLRCSHLIDQNDTWEDAAHVKESHAKLASEAAQNPPCIVRPQGEPIVVTILIYKAVKTFDACHVTPADVAQAKYEMSRMLALCDASCKLSELAATLAN